VPFLDSPLRKSPPKGSGVVIYVGDYPRGRGLWTRAARGREMRTSWCHALGRHSYPAALPPRTAPPGETGADRPGRARGSDAEPDATRTVGPDEPRVVRAVVGGLHRGRATDRAGGRAPARVRCRHWMGRSAMARRPLVHRYTGRRVAAAGDPGDGPHPLSAGHRRFGGAHELLRGHRPARAADHPGAQVDPVRDAVRRLALVGGGRRRHGGVQRPGLARRTVAVRPG